MEGRKIDLLEVRRLASITLMTFGLLSCLRKGFPLLLPTADEKGVFPCSSKRNCHKLIP